MCALGTWLQRCRACARLFRHGRTDTRLCREAETQGKGVAGRCVTGLRRVETELQGHQALGYCGDACKAKAARDKAKADKDEAKAGKDKAKAGKDAGKDAGKGAGKGSRP